jgi:DNA polymerase-3 subunit delta'
MIVGHKIQREFLKKSFESSRISHAYLFSGVDGLGKKTVALEFD